MSAPSWTALLLAGAILSEVSGTLCLRVASVSRRPAFYGPVALGYVLSFVLLAATLDRGLAVGVAYGIWAACGVALTAVAGRVLFGDPLSRRMLLGIVLVIGGVVLIDLG